jgi:hypothetical protein
MGGSIEVKDVKSRRVIGKLVVELDDTGAFTVKGNALLLLVFAPNEETMALVSKIAQSTRADGSEMASGRVGYRLPKRLA